LGEEPELFIGSILDFTELILDSAHPQMVFFRDIGVGRLDLTHKSSFPDGQWLKET